MAYDVKCYELAKSFIEDSELNKRENVGPLTESLAQTIQDAIEDFINDAEKVRP